MNKTIKTSTGTFVSMARPDENKLIKFINITARAHDIIIVIERRTWKENIHITPPYTKPFGGDFVGHEENITFSPKQIKRIQRAYSIHKATREDTYYINCSTKDGIITEITMPKESMAIIDRFSPKPPTTNKINIAFTNTAIPA